METYLNGTLGIILMVISIQKWDILDNSQGDTKPGMDLLGRGVRGEGRGCAIFHDKAKNY
jgi:hypothetical protein